MNARLVGATLGDSDEQTPSDARSFARRFRKEAAATAQANRRAAEERAAQKKEQASMQTYDEQDLQGLRVGHGADDLTEGDHVLTLRDAKVLDEEEDELVDVHLLDRATEARNARRKAGVKTYTGTEEGSRGLLFQYDQEDEEAGENFRLGAGQADGSKKLAEARPVDAKGNVSIDMSYQSPLTCSHIHR